MASDLHHYFVPFIKVEVSKDLNSYRFETELSSGEDEEGKEISIFHVRVHSDSTYIAHAAFKVGETLEPLIVDTDENYRRQGIATAMYDLAEKEMSRTITPSEDQTPAMKYFWFRRLSE